MINLSLHYFHFLSDTFCFLWLQCCWNCMNIKWCSLLGNSRVHLHITHYNRFKPLLYLFSIGSFNCFHMPFIMIMSASFLLLLLPSLIKSQIPPFYPLPDRFIIWFHWTNMNFKILPTQLLWMVIDLWIICKSTYFGWSFLRYKSLIDILKLSLILH